jgi:hypothetical protein
VAAPTLEARSPGYLSYTTLLDSTAERAFRELISMKGEVEYGTALISLAKAKPLVRRAEFLVDLAKRLVRQP